mmetsp:Transcript_20460/g.21240  ORF Transcript_20460/g.21240 Transcript_20460/m.21240 type:complete len:176 (-) Transcript_20460:233-760(-)
MRIQVKTLTGKSANIEVDQNTNIDQLSQIVENVFSVPTEEQKLLFNGKILSNGTIEEYGIVEEAAIHMVVALEGGKGKKKKKKVKKPKKKHTKRKVKLAILNYFKVDDGKVVRLRQRSPTGTFMAEHSDRYYCGRSHITYKKKEGASKPVEKKAEKPVAEAKPVEEKGGKKGKKK